MVIYGNSLELIGARKHHWDTSNKVSFGRYCIELSHWAGEWHAVVVGPLTSMNTAIVELAFYSDKDKAKVSKLALGFLHEHTSK
jgi:hypothetical protein